MNRIIHIIIASLAFYSCASQKNAKVYAYRQPVFQGARPTTVLDEKGKEVEMPVKEHANFFIYLELPPGDVQVKEIWIKQKPYTAKTGIVTSTPVVITPQVRLSAPADTLVKATNNKVLWISPQLPMELKAAESLQKKMKGNELVIHCVVNGKDQYYTAAAIKNLPPVALQ